MAIWECHGIPSPEPFINVSVMSPRQRFFILLKGFGPFFNTIFTTLNGFLGILIIMIWQWVQDIWHLLLNGIRSIRRFLRSDGFCWAVPSPFHNFLLVDSCLVKCSSVCSLSRVVCVIPNQTAFLAYFPH